MKKGKYIFLGVFLFALGFLDKWFYSIHSIVCVACCSYFLEMLIDTKKAKKTKWKYKRSARTIVLQIVSVVSCFLFPVAWCGILCMVFLYSGIIDLAPKPKTEKQ